MTKKQLLEAITQVVAFEKKNRVRHAAYTKMAKDAPTAGSGAFSYAAISNEKIAAYENDYPHPKAPDVDHRLFRWAETRTEEELAHPDIDGVMSHYLYDVTLEE